MASDPRRAALAQGAASRDPEAGRPAHAGSDTR